MLTDIDRSHGEHPHAFASEITIFIFSLIATTLGLTLFSLFLHLNLSSAHFPIALLFCFAFLATKLFKLYKRNILRTSIVLLAVFFCFISLFWLCGYFYDNSWDGQWYHQTAIIELANGWNPIYDHTGSAIEWNNYYPKATWLFAATLYKFTNNIESGKFLNILLAIAVFCSSLRLLARLRWLNTNYIIILSLLITLNPVSISQMLTFYVDGILYCLLVLSWVFIISALVNPKEQKISLTLFALANIFLINIKFTGLIYFCITACLILAWVLFLKKRQLLKPIAKAFTITIIVGFCILGFNPYLTNTIQYKSPLHPLLTPKGSQLIQIGDISLPKSLQNKNILLRLFISNFSETSSEYATYVPLKIPFTVRSKEIQDITYDTRLGGLGPLWSGALVLSLFILLFSIYDKPKHYKYCMGLYACIFFSVIINSASWWVRYTPQLWILGILPIILRQDKKILKFCPQLLIIILLVNSLIVCHAIFPRTLSLTKSMNQTLGKLKNREVKLYCGQFCATKVKLEKFGIKYQILDKPLENKKYISLPTGFAKHRVRLYPQI